MKVASKVYIIAEVGINFNGSMENCFRLIDASCEAGCDSVKFQFFKAQELYPFSAGKICWKATNKNHSYDIYSAVKSYELPREWIKDIIAYCRKKRIGFLSSVFDASGAGYLISHGMKMIKIASSSITNLPLIEYCSRERLSIIMSTGGATMGEIEEAVKVVNRHHNKLSLLHCSIKYPTRPRECNLGVIQTLRYAFPDNLIGYSDHTKEVSQAAVQAVYLGARIIEKHITLDRKMKGPDHFFALEPQELKTMVKDIRWAEKTLEKGKAVIDKVLYGTSKKFIYKHERYLRNFCFASIFSSRDIRKGERIEYKDLRLLRPGKKERGLEPKYIELFKKYNIIASKDIMKEEAVSWEKIFNA